MDPDRSTEFWEYLDRLVASHRLVIDRPKGSRHPRYPEYIYPYDYGYLEGSTTVDGGGIDVWLGSSSRKTGNLTAVLITVDLFKHDAEVKLLLDCGEKEIQALLDFHNGNNMRAILVRRPKPLEA